MDKVEYNSKYLRINQTNLERTTAKTDIGRHLGTVMFCLVTIGRQNNKVVFDILVPVSLLREVISPSIFFQLNRCFSSGLQMSYYLSVYLYLFHINKAKVLH